MFGVVGKSVRGAGFGLTFPLMAARKVLAGVTPEFKRSGQILGRAMRNDTSSNVLMEFAKSYDRLTLGQVSRERRIERQSPRQSTLMAVYMLDSGWVQCNRTANRRCSYIATRISRSFV